MTKKTSVLVGLIATVVVVGVGIVVLNNYSSKSIATNESQDGSGRLKRRQALETNDPAAAVRSAMGGLKGKVRQHTRDYSERPTREMFEHLTGLDRKYAEAVQSAIDNDDFKATLAAAEKAMNSTNSEVRANAVEALGWFGVDALPELTGAMADPDEDVSNAAENAWELALGEIDDGSMRFSIAAAAMATISDKNHLATISGLLEGAALEAIDGESDPSKASDMRFSVIQKLVNIMDSGRVDNVNQAKEAYEVITGFEWRGVEEAERYLQDPDNYELPEDLSDSAVSSTLEGGDIDSEDTPLPEAGVDSEDAPLPDDGVGSEDAPPSEAGDGPGDAPLPDAEGDSEDAPLPADTADVGDDGQ